jgi:hypothetical protein
MFLNKKGAFIYYAPTDLGFRSTFPCAPILLLKTRIKKKLENYFRSIFLTGIPRYIH